MGEGLRETLDLKAGVVEGDEEDSPALGLSFEKGEIKNPPIATVEILPALPGSENFARGDLSEHLEGGFRDCILSLGEAGLGRTLDSNDAHNNPPMSEAFGKTRK